MTDESRFQLHARIDELQGELKRAEEQDRLNTHELADKEHALRLAQEAKAKSETHIARIRQELREAGQAYSEAVLALTGDGPVAVEWRTLDNGAPIDGPMIAAAEAALRPAPNYDGPGLERFPNAIFNGLDTEQAQ